MENIGRYVILRSKFSWKQPLVRSGKRREENINMNITDVGCENGIWIFVSGSAGYCGERK
jgi:hypothetical protein